MSPVIFYSLTLGVVEVMQYFLVPFVLKNGTGEPGGSTLFFNLYIYKSFFTFQRMSYGATLAWLLFLITLVLTVRPLRLGAEVGLLRRGALSVSIRRPAAAHAYGRPIAVVPVHADRGGHRGGVPVAAAAGRLDLAEDAGAAHGGQRAPLAGRPGDVRLPGQGVRRLRGAAAGRHHAALALVVKGRTTSQFVDPANPEAGLITWQGSWRALDRAWQFAPHLENFGTVWNLLDYPRLLFNTVVLALVGMVGVLLSCVTVAYGFASFRFPGRNLLFLLLISTIFLPAIVTIIPTYAVWVKLGVVGSSNPADRLGAAAGADLLRQRLRRLPAAPVLPDDPARDGRGGGHGRRGPAPHADLGDHSAVVAGDHRGRDLPLRLLVEQLLRAADLPVDPAGPPAHRGGSCSSSTGSTPASPRCSRPAR